MNQYLYGLYTENEVVKEGHFKLTSGRHSDFYVNKDSIYCDPFLFKQTVDALTNAVQYACAFVEVHTITGPAVAGAVLAAPIALALEKTFVYPEKKQEVDNNRFCVFGEWHNSYSIKSVGMEFRRGYDQMIKKRPRVLLVEDIVTTGKSIMQTAAAIEACGGEVVGICCLWNRTGWKFEKAPMMSLITKEIESWEPDKCPLCLIEAPLTHPKTGEILR